MGKRMSEIGRIEVAGDFGKIIERTADKFFHYRIIMTTGTDVKCQVFSSFKRAAVLFCNKIIFRGFEIHFASEKEQQDGNYF